MIIPLEVLAVVAFHAAMFGGWGYLIYRSCRNV
jgi:hypothetical protein